MPEDLRGDGRNGYRDDLYGLVGGKDEYRIIKKIKSVIARSCADRICTADPKEVSL